MTTGAPLVGKKILLVDDDADRRMLISEFFEIFQADCTCAASGQAGIEAILAGDYDLIILDVVLGDLEGWTVYRKAAEALPDFSTPVLFLTSLGEEARESFESLNPATPCRLESKSISTHELIRVVGEMISSDT